MSILNVLKRKQIVNAIIFVIRYFGGTKLGVPGLIYAYRTAAEDAIKDAEPKPWLEKKRLLVIYPYKLEGVIQSILQKNQAVVIHEDFGENIAIQLEVDVESTDALIESVKELSSGSAQIIIELKSVLVYEKSNGSFMPACLNPRERRAQESHLPQGIPSFL